MKKTNGDERSGIAIINKPTSHKTTTDVLFQGTLCCVTLFKNDTPIQLTRYLEQNYPNVVSVERWVMNYELDNINLFNKQSGTKYTHDCREP